MTRHLEPDDPPAWAFESVHLAAYDPSWAERAAEYADELRPVLAQWLLAPIEHVGSTAIAGI
ncbi:MAG: GrpB family protein, partial [Nocardiopsaceae bacterium]|nr:GrpB family protein [Nocardiopsaceae bacterium]